MTRRNEIRRRLPFAALHRACVAAAALAAAGLLTGGLLTAGAPSPIVTIVAPVDGHVTGDDVLMVEVTFRANVAPQGRASGPTGNVQTVLLTLGGVEVGRHRNLPQVKEGRHSFVVDLSTFPDGPHTLRARGFQGDEAAGLGAWSDPVTLVIDRSPAPPPDLARLVGTVGDDDATLVPGAVVSVYRAGQPIGQTTTDTQGAFDVLIPTDGNPVSVVATAPPPAFHGAATRVLTPLPGGEYHLHLVLWPEEPLLVLGDPDGVPGTVTVSTPDSSVMISGIPTALGIAGGSARAFSPTATPDAFPGDFATRQAGLESGLISAGFVSVNLLQRDAAGAVAPVSALRDAHGNPVWVELRFKIDRLDWPAIQDGARHAHLPGYVDRPDRITAPLYYFDELRGDWLMAPQFGWLEDVNGPIPPAALEAIQGGTYPNDIYMTGLVDHFTWYNLDYPKQDACMVGRLIDTEGNILSFSELTIRSLPAGSTLADGTVISYFSNVIRRVTDAQGRFRVRVPRTETGPDDDWNGNGRVDTFGVVGEVAVGTVEFAHGIFDNQAKGYRTPNIPERDDGAGCRNFAPTENVVVELRQAKLVDFRITFLEALEGGTGDPLFVSPPSFTGPNHAKATLLDSRIAIGGQLWQRMCQTETAFTACHFQSSPASDGVASFTIPVLVREDPGPLDFVEDLSGAFAYRKARPDLGAGAFEFGARNYLVAENRRTATIPVDVQRRGPPKIEILQPDSDPLVFLFDDPVTLEATGTDLNGESIDPLGLFYWSDLLQTRLIAQGRAATVTAGAAFGSGTGHGVVAHGIDFWGWLGTTALGAIEVATVEVAVTPASLALVPGTSGILTAAVAGANNTSVIWTSNNLGVATVSSGIVNAVSPGTAVITARSMADPTKAASVTVEIEELVAAFTLTPLFGDTSTVFTLDASGSTGDIVTYAWDFGDGTTGAGANATYTYGSPGTYTATLTVTSASGLTAQTTRSIPVGTTDPVASFAASPERGNPPLPVTFDASGSFHPDAPVGQIVSWAWDFGDGATGSGQIVNHTYTASGAFAVVLTVTDNHGASGTATTEVRVNAAPVASFSVAPDTAPLTVIVNAAASHDPDGQIERYAWDFGDGTVIADGAVVESHTYAVGGIHTITLTVEDDGGLTSTTERTVTVQSLTAVARFTAEVLGSQPYQTFLLDASSSFPPTGATITSYTWDLGDGSPPISQASPQLTHRYTSAGDFTVVLTVEDGEGWTGVFTQVLGVAPPAGRVLTVESGNGFGLALMTDGTVQAWGWNGLAALGNGTTGGFNPLAARVQGLENVVAIAAGGFHSLALLEDGTVWWWGDHAGVGQSAVPLRVPELEGVVAIAAGDIHSLALLGDGTVRAWGLLYTDDEGYVASATPQPVVNLEEVVAIAAGSDHSLALRDDGTLWSWGLNFYGQLGHGVSRVGSQTPVAVLLNDVVAIEAGFQTSFAVRDDGTLWAWGRNYEHQLGVGFEESNVPLLVPGLQGVSAVSTRDFHTLALTADGSAWGWGENSFSVVSGTFSDDCATWCSVRFASPIAVSLPGGTIQVVASNISSFAILPDGTLVGWGMNEDGRLGDGTTVNRQFPVPVWPQ
jgi:PKD repeat protein/alpha-tubulin suppressor-like RCC1 family protein